MLLPPSCCGWGFTPAGANNGNRSGAGWGSEGWNDESPGNTFPDWLQIDFSGSKTIDEIDVFTVQDNYANPSEPTEAMTFSAYGLTGYDVQYWNGSSWVTVTGGSVTGNNKVWRKFTFAPVTTSKIRVLTNASVDGYSRITELEAWGAAAGASSSAVQWLVTDQLGTPRMVFDHTGNLASMKRHDYLPFGEELFAGVSGRSVAQGYATGDGLRQQFTEKERDIETGLDYSINRYYSPVQGRFISGDPLHESGEPPQPQTWNRYSCSINNPLRFVDPEGLRYVQRTLENGKIEYGWCDTDDCYNNAIDKNSKNYAGWTPVTFDESKPYEYTCECGAGGDRYGRYRLNPDGTHGYTDVLDGNYHAMSTDWNAQLAIGCLLNGFRSLLSGALSRLFASETATQATQQATIHGAERLAERGFSQADIILTKSGQQFLQKDGATVFIKEVAPGKFNVLVEGQRGVVTALKNISEKKLAKIAANYGWYTPLR